MGVVSVCGQVGQLSAWSFCYIYLFINKIIYFLPCWGKMVSYLEFQYLRSQPPQAHSQCQSHLADLCFQK